MFRVHTEQREGTILEGAQYGCARGEDKERETERQNKSFTSWRHNSGRVLVVTMYWIHGSKIDRKENKMLDPEGDLFRRYKVTHKS
jgi:hypothetical protein